MNRPNVKDIFADHSFPYEFFSYGSGRLMAIGIA